MFCEHFKCSYIWVLAKRAINPTTHKGQLRRSSKLRRPGFVGWISQFEFFKLGD